MIGHIINELITLWLKMFFAALSFFIIYGIYLYYQEHTPVLDLILMIPGVVWTILSFETGDGTITGAGYLVFWNLFGVFAIIRTCMILIFGR